MTSTTPSSLGIVPWPEELAAQYRTEGYWKDELITQALWRIADRLPSKEVVIDGEVRLTWQELRRRSEAIAANILDLGLEPDDRIVVQLPNTWEFVALTLACFRSGVIPVMTMPAHRRHELEYIADLAEARAIVVPDEHRGYDHQELAEEIRETVAPLEHVIVLGERVRGNNIAFADLWRTPSRDGAGRLDALEISPDAVALFLLSGGTTGLPKLIPRSHNDYLYNAEKSAEVSAFTEGTVYLVALPAGHNFPLACPGILGALAAGGSVVMIDSPRPERVFAQIAEEGVTDTAAVPAVVQRWIDHEAEHRTGMLETLQVLQVGGSRLVDELAARVEPVLGCTLQQVFGMAEGLVNMTALDDPEEVIITTQGRPISPGDLIRVVDEDGDPLPPGDRGILHTRGPYTLRGYYRAKEQNKTGFTDDGWYITGDIVELRPDGNLVVSGRDKDLINRGGEKVSGEEVENLIYRHPGIDMVAAVASQDPDLGERVCVYVTTHPDSSVTLEELRELMIGEEVAAYKLPEVLVVIDDMPLTKVGKVDKKALREDLISRGRLTPGTELFPSS